jgi:hypothetical protein
VNRVKRVRLERKEIQEFRGLRVKLVLLEKEA